MKPVLPVALDYFAPEPALRHLISSYYFFRSDLPRMQDLTRADLPQIRFMLAGAGSYRFGQGLTATTPAIAVTGPTMAATRIDVWGPAFVFGISLLPAGWDMLVGASAHAARDGVEDGAAIFGAIAEEVLDRLRWAPSLAAMQAIADRFVHRVAARASPREPQTGFTAIADAWLVGDASPSVDALTEATGLSARQVERLCNRLYGAPPKLLARKYRALRAASLIGAGEDWRGLFEDAFYDQSHAIREFRRFVGMSPTELARTASPVTRLTLDRRRLADHLPKLTQIS